MRIKYSGIDLKSLYFYIQKRFLFFVLTFIFLLIAQSVFACVPKKNELEWIEQTLRIWDKTRKDSLLFSSKKLPWLILFDESCVLHINPDLSVFKTEKSATTKLTFNRQSFDVYSQNHDGKITLPNKEEVPARLLSFASNYDGGKKSFLVSAMPSIWQKAEHLKEEKNLDALVRGVFVHEMTHTFHQNYYMRLDELEKQLSDIENFDDDIIQNTFGKKDEFRKAYEIEHDLLYRAVNENNLARKSELAKNALNSIRVRRKQFYVGKDTIYAEIEETFLTMEGAANWAAYKSAIEQGLSQTDALKLIRRSGKYWSQDEGIALFVVIDSLLPRWQKKAFGKSAVSVIELLEEAVR